LSVDKVSPAAGGRGVTRFATRGGHRLSYESSGSAAGIQVLGLHDLLADRGQMRPLADLPEASSLRLTLPDARGHGASPTISARKYPFVELAADGLAVLDAEGVRVAHVAAFGWASAIALQMAVSAPERVASLVLVEPYLPWLLRDRPEGEARRVGEHHIEAIRAAATVAEKGQTDRALDLILDVRLGAGWRDRLSKVRLGAIRRSAGNLGPLLAGMTDETPSLRDLRSVATPLTLLLPENAPADQRWTVDLLAELPQARVKLVPGESDWTAPLAHALAEPRVSPKQP
jgi:pimeloyl-ACP methyl ester carboxylesterase